MIIHLVKGALLTSGPLVSGSAAPRGAEVGWPLGGQRHREDWPEVLLEQQVRKLLCGPGSAGNRLLSGGPDPQVHGPLCAPLPAASLKMSSGLRFFLFSVPCIFIDKAVKGDYV